MEGYDVFFLMGNDENTVKVSKRAAELGKPVQEYCDEMARQFREVWMRSTSATRSSCRPASPGIMRVRRRSFRRSTTRGTFASRRTRAGIAEGLKAFKTERNSSPGSARYENWASLCRSEPCYFFELSKFQDWLLAFSRGEPGLHPAREPCNEIITLIKNEGLQDVNITRRGESGAWRRAVRSRVHRVRLV